MSKWIEDRCLIIAEIAQAHDGSLGMAHAYIDAVAKTGADGIKFQTHIADAESSPDEPWRVKFSLQDKTRYDYWHRMEFTDEQWHGLKRHADEKGLLFLSSPFSIQAVMLLERVGVWAWKVASGEISNMPMLYRMSETNIPFILSSGMSDLAELDAAVELVRSFALPFGVLQCTTSYPCPPEKIGLNMLQIFSERYGCPVGLSDHSGTIYPGLTSVVMGGKIIEVHVTFDKDMFGPDVSASLTMNELKQLIDGVRFTEQMMQAPIDKDSIAKDLATLRSMFTKSIVAVSDLAAGTILSLEHLTVKKPGIGIPAEQMNKIIGRRLSRDVLANTRLSETDLDL